MEEDQCRYAKESFNSQQDSLCSSSTAKVCWRCSPHVPWTWVLRKERCYGSACTGISLSQLPITVPKMAISQLNKLSLFYQWAWWPCKWHGWLWLSRWALQHPSRCSLHCLHRLETLSRWPRHRPAPSTSTETLQIGGEWEDFAVLVIFLVS